MRKIFIAAILAVTIIFLLYPGMQFFISENQADNWSHQANRDTTWKDGAVSTAGQLAQFAYLVNTGTYTGSGSIYLTQDIDLSGMEWTAIGQEYGKNYFSGEFNGNNFTIKNMKISKIKLISGTEQRILCGLFGFTDGEIKNLTVSGSIDNHTEIQVDKGIELFRIVGGIVAYNEGSIVDCINNVNINADSEILGGVCGFNAGNIERCGNNGHLTGGSKYAGGVAGYSGRKEGSDIPYISNCFNLGDIVKTEETEGLHYGGIAGYMNGTYVENCFNTGEIDAGLNEGSFSGGIAGELNEPDKDSSGKVENCYYLDTNSSGLGLYGNIVININTSQDKGFKKSGVEMKEEGFVKQLNGKGDAFVFNPAGYPVLKRFSSTVAFNTEPRNASVSVKHEDVVINSGADGMYHLVPGEYTAEASLENYETKFRNFTVTLNEASQIVDIALSVLPADYSEVEDEKSNIPKDLSNYTDESVGLLNDAVGAVAEGLDITEQARVDEFAKAIRRAVGSLKPKEFKSPETSGDINIMLVILILLISCGGLFSIVILTGKSKKYINDFYN